MKRIGDDASGFSAAYDASTGAVRVRAWGFWNAEVATLFDGTVRDVCGGSPPGVSLWMDMAELKPLREEGQRSFGTLIGSLGKLGVGRTTVVTASHLTKLQLLRLVTEHGGKDTVDFTTSEPNLAPTLTAATKEGKE